MIYGLVVIIPPSTANYMPAFQNCAHAHGRPQIWKFLFSLQRQRFIISPFIQHLLTQSTRYSRRIRVELNQARPAVSRRV